MFHIKSQYKYVINDENEAGKRKSVKTGSEKEADRCMDHLGRI